MSTVDEFLGDLILKDAEITALRSLVKEMGNVLQKVSVGYYQIKRIEMVGAAKEILNRPTVVKIMEAGE